MKIVKHFSDLFFSEQLIAFVSEERSRGLVYPPGTYFYCDTVRHLSAQETNLLYVRDNVLLFLTIFSKGRLFLDHSLSN